MQDLYRLIYFSSAIRDMSDEDLEAILSKSRENNIELGISGLLLYSEGDFFQVLEGPLKPLRALYQVIRKDPRHDDCIEIGCEPIESREFEDWSMGYRRASRAEVERSVPGFSNLLERRDLGEEFCKKTSDDVITFLKKFRGEALD